MSEELIGIIGVAIALAALIVTLHRTTRGEIADLRKQIERLRERMAGLEAIRERELLDVIKKAVSVSGAIREQDDGENR